MSRIISILSGKGGVGKTTVAVNLSSTLSLLGFKTCVVDVNFTTPHLSTEFGTFSKGLEIEPSQINSNLWLVSMPLSLSSLQYLDLEEIKRKIKNLKNEFSFIILDSAPGFGREALISLELADEVLIVVNPVFSSLMDALKLKKLSIEMGKKVSGIIVNKRKYSKYEIEPEDIQKLLEAPIIGIIKENKEFIKYSFLHKPIVFENEEVRKEFEIIARAIAYGEILQISQIEKENLLSKIKKKLFKFFP